MERLEKEQDQEKKQEQKQEQEPTMAIIVVLDPKVRAWLNSQGPGEVVGNPLKTSVDLYLFFVINCLHSWCSPPCTFEPCR